MNAYQRAAVWVRFMAAAMANPDNARDQTHLSSYAQRCARAADFALAEYIARHDKPKGGA